MSWSEWFEASWLSFALRCAFFVANVWFIVLWTIDHRRASKDRNDVVELVTSEELGEYLKQREKTKKLCRMDK